MAKRFKVPTFSYPGGKAKLAPWFVSMMPRTGGCYCEPFAGRANVFFRAACSGLAFDRWVLNDLDTHRFLRAILDVDPCLIPFAVSWEHAKVLVTAAAEGTDPLASLVEPLIAFCGGLQGRSGRTRTFRGETYKKTVQRARMILRRTRATITSVDWQECVSSLGVGDFVYVDPPYVDAKTRYRICEVDHNVLASFLSRADFKWILSGYDNDIYQSILGAPIVTRTQATSISITNSGKAPQATECVWANYDIRNP